MPITCTQLDVNDILFYVIFRSDYNFIKNITNESLQRLHKIAPCTFTESYLHNLKNNIISLPMLKAIFFLLLNVDMTLKVCVANVSEHLYIYIKNNNITTHYILHRSITPQQNI